MKINALAQLVSKTWHFSRGFLRGRILAIFVAFGLLIVTALGVVFNEGILSPFPSIDEDTRPNFFVTRNQCTTNFDNQEYQRNYPIVQVFSRPSHSNYFSSTIEGTISFSFVGFFEDCREVEVDFSELNNSTLLRAEVAVYSEDTGDGGRYISRNSHEVSWITLPNGTTVFSLPEGKAVANLVVTMSNLLLRAGSAEFFFDGHFKFFDIVASGDEVVKKPLGGTFARLVAVGLEQRAETSNPYDGGAPELVRTIWFGKLESMNRFFSTLLATLLGIWIGIILESLLALTILREVRSSLRGEKDLK